MAKTLKEDTLTDFSWEGGEVEFFGQKLEPDTALVDEKMAKEGITEVETEEDIEEKGKKEEKVKSKEKEEPEKKTQTEGFEDFEDPTEDEEEEEEGKKKETKSEKKKKPDDEEEPEPEDKKGFFTQLSKELKESGVFSNVEIEDDSEIDEDTFFDLHEQEVEARVEETFESFFEEMDEEAREFLKFKKNGGKTKNFLAKIQKDAQKPTGDVDDPKFQKKFLEYYYTEHEGMDKEDVDDRIAWLEDGDKIENYFKKFDKKVTTKQKAEKEQLLKDAETQSTKKSASRDKFRTDMNKVLEKSDDLEGFPITKKEKSLLLNYVARYDVKVAKNNYVTKFQRDLQKSLSDDKKLLLIAKLVMNNFDTKDLQKRAETKVIKKVKSQLENAKKTTKPTVSSGSSSGKKSLYEYFD